jgi:hypothetical protein
VSTSRGEVHGLQAGLGFRPGEKRAYRHGEEATVVLRVRNVGKEAVEFKHIGAFFVENPPTITDADGKGVKLPRVFAEGLQAPHSTNVAPGKEVELYEWNIHLLPKGATSKNLVRIHGTGKFSLQCKRIVGPTSGNPNHPNPTLGKLATGKLALEVKDAEKLPEKKEEKEGFTTWGKEVGGLQAGLGFRPGQKRAYRPGETVRLVVRVRNVGHLGDEDEEVKFQYLRQFFIETPPAVTDGEGKPVPLPRVTCFGIHIPVNVSLAPGKEIELYELKLELRPASEIGNDRGVGVPRHSTLYGTGKFSVQYERVLGNSSSGTIKLNPRLTKLATGKLELEVKADLAAANVLGSSAGQAHAQPAREAGEKRITVKFDKAPWAQVLKWYSDQTGLPVLSEHRPPPGSFSHASPNGATYSVREVTIVLNESLMKQGYVLVPRRQSVVMLRIAK